MVKLKWEKNKNGSMNLLQRNIKQHDKTLLEVRKNKNVYKIKHLLNKHEHI